jgi:hypothetical protein
LARISPLLSASLIDIFQFQLVLTRSLYHDGNKILSYCQPIHIILVSRFCTVVNWYLIWEVSSQSSENKDFFPRCVFVQLWCNTDLFFLLSCNTTYWWLFTPHGLWNWLSNSSTFSRGSCMWQNSNHNNTTNTKALTS